MPKEATRSERVAAQLQRELADLLRTEVKDPRVGWVTVHRVEVSRDLSVAKVYLGFLEEEGEAATACFEALKHSAPFLRRELGRRMRMRIIPELRFLRDEGYQHALRISQLLREIREKEGTSTQDEDPEVIS